MTEKKKGIEREARMKENVFVKSAREEHGTWQIM